MLSVRNLCAWYGQAQVLFGMNITARRNEVIALIGRNGAGKSTTFKSIAGVLTRVTGEIDFDGTTIAGRESHVIARCGLAYVPEDRRVFKDLTVAENLAAGRLQRRPGYPSWDAEKLYAIFPNLAERRDSEAGRLSGGEQQMLTIGRALMGNPKAILLDEPSEGLSPVMIDKVADVIHALKAEGVTIVMSEQNMHFATEVADRVYIVEKGRVIHESSIADMQADSSLTERYLAV